MRRKRLLLLWAGLLILLGCLVLGWAWSGGAFDRRPAKRGAGNTPATGPARAGNRIVMTPASQLRTIGMAGEFEYQSALLLGCNDLVAYHPHVFQAIAGALYQKIPVVAVVSSKKQLATAQRLLEQANLPRRALHFLVMPLNTMWLRDYGPLFVRHSNGRVVIVDTEYTKVDRIRGERPEDDRAPEALAELFGLPVARLPIRTEGGNLLTNGEGLIVSTYRLIGRNVDRGVSAEDIAGMLAKHLAGRRWVLLKELAGEPTGHADLFMTFLGTKVAVVGQIDKSQDPVNAEILDEAARVLSRQTTSRGPVRIYRIPMPPRLGKHWRTYTNVIFANGTLLVPSYAGVDPKIEQQAFDLYRRLLPGWEVIPIPGDTLVVKRGLLHCISINVPQFVSAQNLQWDVPVFNRIQD